MIIERLPEPFEVLVVKDSYTEEELQKVWQEIDFMSNEKNFKDPEKTGSAVDEFGNPIKNNKGIWFSEFYGSPDSSYIHSTFPEKFMVPEVGEPYISMNPMHGIFPLINHHSTLLNYYDEGGMYENHVDLAVYTACTYLYREPKSFDGGHIVFQINEEVAYEQPIENNMTVFFPSFYFHRVTEVTMNENLEDSWMGRYSITHFLRIKDT